MHFYHFLTKLWHFEKISIFLAKKLPFLWRGVAGQGRFLKTDRIQIFFFFANPLKLLKNNLETNFQRNRSAFGWLNSCRQSRNLDKLGKITH